MQANEPRVAEELVNEVEAMYPGQRSLNLEAHAARFRARLLAKGGRGEDVDQKFQEATTQFRGIGYRFWLAVTLLEHGEWLIDQKRADEATPRLEEAGAIFETLRARPWLERLAKALPQREVAPA